MKTKALDKKLLMTILPDIGQYLKAYFSKEPNDVFSESQLSNFINNGWIDDNTWRLLKAISNFEDCKTKTVKFELKIEIIR